MLMLGALLLCAVMVVLAFVAAAAVRDAREARREAGEAELRLSVVRASYAAFSKPLLWARWWGRNGAENNAPAEREAMQRIALMALLSDGENAMREALQLFVRTHEAACTTETRPVVELARVCLRELEALEPAWERWAREVPEQPQHSAALVSRAQFRALRGEYVQFGGHPETRQAFNPALRNVQ